MEEKTNQLDEKGLATGFWRYWYFSDTLMGEGFFEKGLRFGLWKWFENTKEGVISEEEIYIT